MIELLRDFRIAEDGAMTVDWVVLTGGLLILGIVVAIFVTDGSTAMAGSAGNALGAAVVPDVVL